MNVHRAVKKTRLIAYTVLCFVYVFYLVFHYMICTLLFIRLLHYWCPITLAVESNFKSNLTVDTLKL